MCFEVVDALKPSRCGGRGGDVDARTAARRLVGTTTDLLADGEWEVAANVVFGELSETTRDEPVPEHLRPALRAELDALVRGERPEQMLYVEEYGDDGATLVVQPEAVWDHRSASATQQDDGSWWVILPIWTELECPSDLSAELEVDASGAVTIRDLHVMWWS